MKKVLLLSLSLLCCVLMGISLSSCGDDEPIISNEIDDDGTPPVVYVHSELGWDDYCLYIWKNASPVSASWPGEHYTSTKTFDGEMWYVFELPKVYYTTTGTNWIINNNNGGKQYELMQGFSYNKDIYIRIAADGTYSDFVRSEFYTPMFLFESPSSGVIPSIVNGFSFWTFTNTKAAYGTFYFSGNRAMLKCTELHSAWSLSGGKLILSNTSHNIKRVNLLGVNAFNIDIAAYFPSNLKFGDFKGETVFTELGINKEKLWQGLEKAKAEGPIYLDEL